MTNRHASTRATKCLLLAVLCCLVIWVVIGPLRAYLDFARSVETFPKRHREATQFVKAVYEYYSDQGRWPDPGDVHETGIPSLPAEWTYDWAEQEGGPPVLLLHGPYHMAIVYYFSPPSDRGIDRTWVLSIEGDKKKFQADVDYD
jgi:fermentation-respiration switch protein FrsA (DUF1100 family)